MSRLLRRFDALFTVLFAVSGCATSVGPPGTAGPIATPPPSTAPATDGTPTAAPASPATNTPAAPGTSSPSPTAGGGGPSDLILRVSSGGGLRGPAPDLRAIPAFSLYRDGRFITQGAQTEIYPGPLLPPILEMRLTPGGIELLLAAAGSAGLAGPDRDLRFDRIADATTTVFTVVVPEGRHRTSVYALHEAGGSEGQLPNGERAARAALKTFEQQLFDLRTALGAEDVSDAQPYTPTGMRIFSQVAHGAVDPGLPTQDRPWPLADLATFGEPWPAPGGATRCGVLDGADLASLLPIFRESNQLTRWLSSDTAYQLTLRPLLPDERGCALTPD